MTARARAPRSPGDAFRDLDELRHRGGKQLERGVPLADVVERELKAVLAIAGQDEAEALLVGDRLPLGDLQDDGVGLTFRPPGEQEHVVDG